MTKEMNDSIDPYVQLFLVRLKCICWTKMISKKITCWMYNSRWLLVIKYSTDFEIYISISCDDQPLHRHWIILFDFFQEYSPFKMYLYIGNSKKIHIKFEYSDVAIFNNYLTLKSIFRILNIRRNHKKHEQTPLDIFKYSSYSLFIIEIDCLEN